MSTLFLVINVGSTSIKTRLFDTNLHGRAIFNADYSSQTGLVIEGRDYHGVAIHQNIPSPHDTEAALAVVLNEWRRIIAQDGLLLAAIGHRIVHGASWFDTVTLLDKEVLNRLIQLDDYAPLHNPFNRLGVTRATDIFPDVPQFAVFDTAFHRTIPEYAGRYALPEKLAGKVDFYRYGFHGISCQHSLSAAAALLDKDQATLNLIVLHLGGGASITAIRAGVSVDTSMGFSPAEGLIMSGRCGDLDPMIPVTLQRQGMSLDQLETILNYRSGMIGICGEADMRTILKRAEQGEPSALLALDMYCYRIKKYIGAYWAILGEVSALIFTGGIGEHAPAIRYKIIQGLDKLGFSLDLEANQRQWEHTLDLSDQNSRSRILVISSEEEREIARQIAGFLATASYKT
ncbi:Acetate kinase [Candidatus Methylobacter favarea]|uniref:Acetate kinase n=1 Tax=Candidatus Methylobacter favarea TaxID=2707345 RepID=A0A8S0X0M5_9GAMM|nr:acetate/propionate family kinase [Candidatus Methylobacter favarea]CAA9890698.1 Acetate kinase [Candidatus Methylobacter favarea]